MKTADPFFEWQLGWGSPRGIFSESEGRMLEVAFLVALLIHFAPMALLWHKQKSKKAESSITLQNVELMQPETEAPPPPPAVQKPKSVFDFLKMALPVFKKVEPVPEAPREVIPMAKPMEPKLAETEKLVEKKMTLAPNAPEIKLNLKSKEAPPNLMDISKFSPNRAEVRAQDPALKLEEVGRRAVTLPPSAPSISLNSTRSKDKVLEMADLPKTRITAGYSHPEERLVDRGAPPSRAPSAPSNLPYGYERRGGSSFSLDQPREVKSVSAPKLNIDVPRTVKKEQPAGLSISKGKVKITGPLSSRKVISFSVPQYPDWARAQGIEADVAIKFVVSESGEVLPGAVVERTSGYTPLDKLALDELKKWRFSSSPGSGDQWGVITFKFQLE